MMSQTDAAAVAAELDPLVIRPYAGEADLPELLRVMNSDLATDGVRERWSFDDLAAQFRHASEHFDPTTDALVAEVDGQMVGMVRVDWVDMTDGLREYRSRAAVDGAWRGRGIGRRLLEAAETLLRERAAAHETDRPRVFGAWVDEKQVARRAILTAAGYEPVRWFFVMERPRIDVERPDIVPLPAGLEVRPVSRADAEAIWRADHEAFLDHWGGFDDSEANFLRWVESPEFQPERFVVAWDGDEIAGAVLNVIYAEENEALGLRRGWLDSVFTRRRWRGRGLARALIGRSIHVLAEAGMDTAALGVDADNPSGALGLYQSCGFVEVERAMALHRPFETGR